MPRKATAYEPYLDGYGFYKTAAAIAKADRKLKLQMPTRRVLVTRLTNALGLLATAYPTAERPESLNADAGALVGGQFQIETRAWKLAQAFERAAFCIRMAGRFALGAALRPFLPRTAEKNRCHKNSLFAINS